MKKYIWEGAVGVVLQPKPDRHGEYFWTFEFVRCFRQAGVEEMRYGKSFTQRNADALGKALDRAFEFMTTTSASSLADTSAP